MTIIFFLYITYLSSWRQYCVRPFPEANREWTYFFSRMSTCHDDRIFVRMFILHMP